MAAALSDHIDRQKRINSIIWAGCFDNRTLLNRPGRPTSHHIGSGTGKSSP